MPADEAQQQVRFWLRRGLSCAEMIRALGLTPPAVHPTFADACEAVRYAADHLALTADPPPPVERPPVEFMRRRAA